MSNVVTRFAPSPTGFLHIGGARTALFNYLLARANGGRFLLRVEDTDKARSTQEAVDAILDGLRWLGLEWDGDVVFQSQRQQRHAEIAASLLKAGNAYRCYATAEELTAMRETARAEGRPPRYDGLWRDRDASEAPDRPHTIRLRMPKDGATIIRDGVQGDVAIQNKELDDLILLRSDGTPTYMLSVVVDDHDMGVTQILRGDDHLTNAARQIAIYDLLGWPAPAMAHVPLIHGPDGAKLSKRHGALGIEAYRAMGYLPAALRNYLVRLGWAHGDEEILSEQQMLEWFGLDGMGKSPARIDFKKLENLNGIYMRETGADVLTRTFLATLPHLPGGDEMALAMTDARVIQLRAAMPSLQERAKTLVELVDASRFLWTERPLTPDEKAAKLLDQTGRATIAELAARFAALELWTADALEGETRAYAEAVDLKLGKVAQPLRAALTGKTTSPGIFDVLLVLGREESLARLADCAAPNPT